MSKANSVWNPFVLLAITMISIQVSLLGCADSTGPRGRVNGKVTIDGVPLSKGEIRFFALSGGIGADGQVVEGVYDIPIGEGMTAGKYRVELSSRKSTGKKVPDRDGGPGDMKEEVIESLPAKLNVNSNLQIEFDPKNSKPFDFDLSLKK